MFDELEGVLLNSLIDYSPQKYGVLNEEHDKDIKEYWYKGHIYVDTKKHEVSHDCGLLLDVS